MIPEEPPRATALVTCLLPFSSPISLFLENRNCLWKNSLESSQERWERSLENKWERIPTNLQAEPRHHPNQDAPLFPRTGWKEANGVAFPPSLVLGPGFSLFPTGDIRGVLSSETSAPGETLLSEDFPSRSLPKPP